MRCAWTHVVCESVASHCDSVFAVRAIIAFMYIGSMLYLTFCLPLHMTKAALRSKYHFELLHSELAFFPINSNEIFLRLTRLFLFRQCENGRWQQFFPSDFAAQCQIFILLFRRGFLSLCPPTPLSLFAPRSISVLLSLYSIESAHFISFYISFS